MNTTHTTKEVTMSTTITRKPSMLEMRQLAFDASGDPLCTCCGEARSLRVFGDRHAGQVYWSAPFCSIECHDEWHYG